MILLIHEYSRIVVFCVNFCEKTYTTNRYYVIKVKGIALFIGRILWSLQFLDYC
jgi:hypothetical protein